MTVTEVAVLIGLVVILGLLLLPTCGCGGSKEAARRNKTETVVRNIAHALNNFAEDHGTLPRVAAPHSPSDPFILVGSEAAGAKYGNELIFDVLRSIPRGINAGYVLNPRKQKYFEEAKAIDPKNPREGFTDGPEFGDAQGRLFDPWGEQYCVVVNPGGDKPINLGNIYADMNSPAHVIPRGSAVFSLGKDGVMGSRKHPGMHRAEPASDDIASWDQPSR